MTFPDSITLWGGGRWAINYINALNSLSSSLRYLYIVTDNKSFLGSTKNSIVIPKSNISNIPKSCQHSIIVNNNQHHDFSVNKALDLKHHILCEKPLMLSKATSKNLIVSSKKNQLCFWESMLPLYCTYFDKINCYVDFVDTFQLQWHDPAPTNKGTYSKRFDNSISYTEDIIPHSISIYKKIFGDVQHISIKKFIEEKDKGSFCLENLKKGFFCFCERYASTRVRTLSGYLDKAKLFEFDFSTEPGKFIYEDQNFISDITSKLDLRSNAIRQNRYTYHFSSPIKEQIIAFLQTSCNAHIDSTNLVRVHNYSIK